MRRRLTAVFLALVTAAVGPLAGATPAGATELTPTCRYEPNSITCGINVPAGMEILSMQWFVNADPYSNSGSSTGMEMSCTPGVTYALSYDLRLTPPPPPGERFTGNFFVTCTGARIANLYTICSSGGSRMRCMLTYDGGTPPVSIRWTVDGNLRTFFNDKHWLDISCRAPSEMYISVTVSDAYGGETSAGYCWCHSGPLD